MKKPMYKRMMSFLLCLTLVCVGFAAGFGSLTAAAYSDWDEAYAAYLREFVQTRSEDYDMNHVRFDLAYIDANDVPELIISLGTSHHSELEIVTFNGAEAEAIGVFYASGGAIEYYKGKGVICLCGADSGDGWNNFYEIISTTYQKLDHFRCTMVKNSEGAPQYDNTGKPVYKWTINEKEVTEREYNKQLDHYDELYGTRETCGGQYELTDTGMAARLRSVDAPQNAGASGRKGSDDRRKRTVAAIVLYALASVICAVLAVVSARTFKKPHVRTRQKTPQRRAQPVMRAARPNAVRPPELPTAQPMVRQPEPVMASPVMRQPEPVEMPPMTPQPEPVQEIPKVQLPEPEEELLVWQPEMTKKPTETPTKKKKRPFRYQCSEADHGGVCEMCGIDVGILMQIDAIKGEKVNTRYFCRNCAASIMRQVEREQNS